MFEEAWCENGAGVAVYLEVFDDRDMGKFSCWWKDIHAFSNFDKDSVVNKEVFNLIFINETLGKNPSWYPHVFILIHIGVKVNVLDVQAYEFSKFGADNTVEEAFGCVNIRIWSEGFTCIVYFVTSNSDSNLIRVFFLWLVAIKNSRIGCFFVHSFLIWQNEINCVCAFDSSLHATL